MNPEELERLVLGQTEEPLEIQTSADNREAALAMIRQTERTLTIFSRDLDGKIFDDVQLVNAVKDLVLKSRHSRVRIITRDISRILSRGHRLVNLYRRLPTYMDIRLPAKEHASYNSAFLVSDRAGVLFRMHADRYEGTVNFNDQKSAEDLSNLFNDMWEAGREHPDLRILSV